MCKETNFKRIMILLIISISLCFGAATSPAQADEKQEAIRLVEKSSVMFGELFLRTRTSKLSTIFLKRPKASSWFPRHA